MKTFISVVIIVLIVSIITGGYVLSRGLSARVRPTRMETVFARTVRHLAIPHGNRVAVNPIPPSEAVLQEAMAHFADHCATCHANDGSGAVEMGRGLYPNPPDMRLPATEDLSDGELYYIIHNGVRFTGMPAFGDESLGDRDEATWKLVHFIRHLPKITPDDVAAMKAMNPKSPQEFQEEEEIRRFLEGEDVAPAEETHAHHH